MCSTIDVLDDIGHPEHMNHEELCHAYAKAKWTKKLLEDELHALSIEIQMLREETSRQHQAIEVEEENVANRLIRKVESEEHNVSKYAAQVKQAEEESKTLTGILMNARKDESNIENQLEAHQELFLMTLQRKMMKVAQNNNTLAGLLWKEQKKYLSLLSKVMQSIGQKEQQQQEVKEHTNNNVPDTKSPLPQEGTEGKAKTIGEDGLPRTIPSANDGVPLGSLETRSFKGIVLPPSTITTPVTTAPTSGSMTLSTRATKSGEGEGNEGLEEGKIKSLERAAPLSSPNLNAFLSSGMEPGGTHHPVFPSSSFSSSCSSSSFRASSTSMNHSGRTRLSISIRSSPSRVASHSIQLPRTVPPPPCSSTSSFMFPYSTTTMSYGTAAGMGCEATPLHARSSTPLGPSATVGGTAPTVPVFSSSSSVVSTTCSSTLQLSGLPSRNRRQRDASMTSSSQVLHPFRLEEPSKDESGRRIEGEEGKAEGKALKESEDEEKDVELMVPGSPSGVVPSFFLEQLRKKIDFMIAKNDARAKEGKECEKTFQKLVEKFYEQQSEVSRTRAEAERLHQHLKMLRKRFNEMRRGSSFYSSPSSSHGAQGMTSITSSGTPIGSGSSLFLPPEDSMTSTPELMSIAQTPTNQRKFPFMDMLH